MASETLWTNAADHFRETTGQEWALSVASADGYQADELIEGSPWILNSKVRLSTVGEIRALGHDLVPSPPPLHADLILRERPSEALWEELRGVFSQPTKKSDLMEEDR